MVQDHIINLNEICSRIIFEIDTAPGACSSVDANNSVSGFWIQIMLLVVSGAVWIQIMLLVVSGAV